MKLFRRFVMPLGLVLALPVGAQVLSSPLGGGTSTAPAVGGVPSGQGAGVHSPLSPFAPLPKRTDVVPWSVLTEVGTRFENRRNVASFSAAVRALDRKQVRLQGFMMPLGPGEKQWHFLLASVPLTCSFCTPGGPESIVEVRTREPLKYSVGAVVVQGRLQVFQSDPLGLYYRITQAVGVK
jgi:hypothetical protein